MVKHSFLGEMTPDVWLVLRATLVEADMAPGGWFSAADVARVLSLTQVTEHGIRDLFATLVQNQWMTGPVETPVGRENVRLYQLTPAGIERIRALFLQ